MALTTLSPDQWQQLLQSDPQLQQIVQMKGVLNGNGTRTPAVNQYLATKGYQLPEGAGISLGGAYVPPSTTGWGAFFKYGLPALGGIVAAPMVAGALGGAAGAGAGAGAGAEAGSTGYIGADVANVANASEAAVAGGGAAAGAGAAGGLWGTLAKAGPLIGAGAQLGGAAIAAHGNTEAAKIAAASADKALDWQKELYRSEHEDLAPYRLAGQGAVGQLGYGLGLPGYEKGAQAALAPKYNPTTGVINDPGGQGGLVTGLPRPALPTQASPTAQQATAQAGPAQVGTRRLINGQLGEWDGQGWKAVQQ